jgi:hypothetical protein
VRRFGVGFVGHPLFDPSSGTLGKGGVGLCGFEFGGWVWGAREVAEVFVDLC